MEELEIMEELEVKEELEDMEELEVMEEPEVREELEVREGMGEAEEAFRQWGREALVKHARQKLEEWKGTPVHLAVLGPTGAGKASFINTLRGIQEPGHPLAAAVGEEEAGKMCCYKLPGNPEISVWKLPQFTFGNINNHTPTNLTAMVENTARKMDFKKFDAFIFLTSDKFTKTDKTITEVLKQMGKPFYLARTKTEEIFQTQGQGQFSFDTMAREIRAECLDKVWVALPDIPLPHVYLITTQQLNRSHRHFHDNENESLNQHIVDCVPEHKRTAIVLSLPCTSQRMLDMKARELMARAKWLEITCSSQEEAPSSSLDSLRLESHFQRLQLGVDEESLRAGALEEGGERGAALQELIGKARREEEVLVEGRVDSLVASRCAGSGGGAVEGEVGGEAGGEEESPAMVLISRLLALHSATAGAVMAL